MSIEILDARRADVWMRERKVLLMELIGLRHEKLLLERKINTAKVELNKLDSELVGDSINFEVD